jgi:hypothetical protein
MTHVAGDPANEPLKKRGGEAAVGQAIRPRPARPALARDHAHQLGHLWLGRQGASRTWAKGR